MKTLARHLAEELAKGIDRLHEKGLPMDFTKEGLEPILKQLIEVYESAGVCKDESENVSDEVCGGCAYYNRDNGDGLGSVCCHKDGPDLMKMTTARHKEGEYWWQCHNKRIKHHNWCATYNANECTCGLEAGRKKV